MILLLHGLGANGGVWAELELRAVVALGVKVAWTAEELAKAQELAAKPPAAFACREAAAKRFLLVSGLTGLVGTDHPAVERGITSDGGEWRLTADPATIGLGAPDMRGLLAAAEGRVVLARGEHDPLQTTEQLRELDPSAVELPGLGHNAQVEDPAAVWRLVSF